MGSRRDAAQHGAQSAVYGGNGRVYRGPAQDTVSPALASAQSELDHDSFRSRWQASHIAERMKSAASWLR